MLAGKLAPSFLQTIALTIVEVREEDLYKQMFWKCNNEHFIFIAYTMEPELFIQRFVALLDAYHYSILLEHFGSISADMSTKLIGRIWDTLPGFHTPQELQSVIYGDSGRSGTLNQLCSHTFKLSSYLARNNPSYLKHNIVLMERLVAEGRREDAVKLAGPLAEIADKVGDFRTAAAALNFLYRDANIQKLPAVGDLHARCREMLSLETASAWLQLFHMEPEPAELETLQKHCSNSHPAISILAQYVYISYKYGSDMSFFDTEESRGAVALLENKLRKHPYVCIPYMMDVQGRLDYFKLNSPYTVQDSDGRKKLFEKLSHHYQGYRYSKNYNTALQIDLISTQLTMLFTKYHHRLHREDYLEILEQGDATLMDAMLDRTASLLSEKPQNASPSEARRLEQIKACITILKGGKAVGKGIDDMESFLVTYQQLNLKASTGTAYFFLMVGYFSLKKYDSCVALYRRYTKAASGKGIFKGNHLKIVMFYYFAQWQLGHSRQYVAKLEKLLKENYTVTPAAFVELAHYCGLPDVKTS